MLYEILKSAKLGTAAAPDMFTGLLAQKMPFAKGSGEIAELSGVPPLRFKSNGKPLLDWRIVGNTVQGGNPTPSNPVSIQGVGELDDGQYKIPISSGGVTTNIYLGNTQTVRQVRKVVLTGNENIFVYSGLGYIRLSDGLGVRIAPYSDKLIGTDVASASMSAFSITQLPSDITPAILTIKADSNFPNVNAFKTWLAENQITVWYVLSSPETVAVNEPLMKIGDYADSIRMTDTGIVIPTVRGNNVLTVDTTVQPSEVYIKYKK